MNNFLRTYFITGSTDPKIGSGRPRAISTPEIIAVVGEFASSEENEPRAHRTQV